MPVVQTVQYNRHACYNNRAMRTAGYLTHDLIRQRSSKTYKVFQPKESADGSKHRVTVPALYWLLIDFNEPRDHHKTVSVQV
jgi:hypothetical protein